MEARLSPARRASKGGRRARIAELGSGSKAWSIWRRHGAICTLLLLLRLVEMAVVAAEARLRLVEPARALGER